MSISPDSAFDVELRLLSNPVYLSGARDLVTNIAGRFGFDELGCGKIALAIDEALCNIIRHGYDDEPGRPILVRIGFERPGAGARNTDQTGDSASAMIVVIEDEGRQVDPDAIVGRDLEEVRPGGLGVHIIREIMDEVRYERRDGCGMRLTMRKSLPDDGTRADHMTTTATVRYGGRRPVR